MHKKNTHIATEALMNGVNGRIINSLYWGMVD